MLRILAPEFCCAVAHDNLWSEVHYRLGDRTLKNVSLGHGILNYHSYLETHVLWKCKYLAHVFIVVKQRMFLTLPKLQ